MEIDPEDWRQLQNDVREIKIAVAGNEKVGLTGLGSRVSAMENKLRTLDIRLATIIGGSAVLMYVFERFILP